LGTLRHNSTSRNQVGGSIALPPTMCDSKKQTALAFSVKLSSIFRAYGAWS